MFIRGNEYTEHNGSIKSECFRQLSICKEQLLGPFRISACSPNFFGSLRFASAYIPLYTGWIRPEQSLLQARS